MHNYNASTADTYYFTIYKHMYRDLHTIELTYFLRANKAELSKESPATKLTQHQLLLLRLQLPVYIYSYIQHTKTYTDLCILYLPCIY